MEYLKYEIGYNIESAKSQRVIFCTSFIQSHIEDVPKEYSENNYFKLLMAPHMGTSRYQKCPKCGKRSMAKKVMRKNR